MGSVLKSGGRVGSILYSGECMGSVLKSGGRVGSIL
jgi:hypothetical protein